MAGPIARVQMVDDGDRPDRKHVAVAVQLREGGAGTPCWVRPGARVSASRRAGPRRCAPIDGSARRVRRVRARGAPACRANRSPSRLNGAGFGIP
jgi:hypothetical protein